MDELLVRVFDPEDDPVGERDRARVDLLLRRVRGLPKWLSDVLELLDARLKDVRELLERCALEVAREVVVQGLICSACPDVLFQPSAIL